MAGLQPSLNNCTKISQSLNGQKINISLVIGSDRSSADFNDEVSTFPPYVWDLWGRDVDFSHVNTFNGKAVTMDLNKCAISGAKHIIGNAQTFNFAGIYNIQRVFIERFPTSNLQPTTETILGVRSGANNDSVSSSTSPTNFNQFDQNIRYANALSQVVEQVAQAMKSKAILEIEWDPYTCCHEVNSFEIMKQLNEYNPFNGFYIRRLMMEAIDVYTIGYQPTEDRDEEEQGHIYLLFRLIEKEMERMAETMNVSIDSLRERLENEVFLLRECNEGKQLALLDFPTFLYAATIDEFNKAVDNVLLCPLNPMNILQECSEGPVLGHPWISIDIRDGLVRLVHSRTSKDF
jgi:hypothetical protein